MYGKREKGAIPSGEPRKRMTSPSLNTSSSDRKGKDSFALSSSFKKGKKGGKRTRDAISEGVGLLSLLTHSMWEGRNSPSRERGGGIKRMEKKKSWTAIVAFPAPDWKRKGWNSTRGEEKGKPENPILIIPTRKDREVVFNFALYEEEKKKRP